MADFFFDSKTHDNNDNHVKVAHLCRGSASTIPGRIGSLEMLILEDRGKTVVPEERPPEA